MAAYLPPAQSLSHRARISALVSPLRRIKPRVPFWELASHRIPTLWYLYRGLLRDAPSPHIRTHLKWFVRKNQDVTAPLHAQATLKKLHGWLDIFKRAKLGDNAARARLARWELSLCGRHERLRWSQIFEQAIADRAASKRRTLVTGFFRPTLYNKPLPRLKPQPQHISSMIFKRRQARARRMEKVAILNDWQNFVRSERAFESQLEGKVRKDKVPFHRIFNGDDASEWLQHITETKLGILQTFVNDTARINTPFSPELLAKIAEGRKKRDAALRRERERELHGEITPKTLHRARKSPPGYVYSLMTPKQRRLDAIARSSLSEVGYVGMVKRRLGWKVKEREGWRAEWVKNEALDKASEEIRVENERRRRESDSELEHS